MSDLLCLAKELLACHGGLVEPVSSIASASDGSGHALGGLEVLVPEPLARRLKLAEHVRIVEGTTGDNAVRLAYGTELLDRLVDLATETPPLAAVALREPLPSTSDPVAAALGRFTALNFALRAPDRSAQVNATKQTWAGYLVADYRYVADADERREGLLRVVADENVGADIPQLRSLDSHPLVEPVAQAAEAYRLAPCEDSERSLRLLGRAARRALQHAMRPLRESIQRRHLRDRARLRRYFGGLQQEMTQRLDRMRERGTATAELEARQAKIDLLRPELERKLADLKTRYRLKVELYPVAVQRVAVQVRTVVLRAQRRKTERALIVQQSAATRTFDPLCCDACGASVYALALCDTELHILCTACDRARPSPRHCPACGGKRRTCI